MPDRLHAFFFLRHSFHLTAITVHIMKSMSQETLCNRPLILDLPEWISQRSRTYHDVIAVWRTSCLQFTIWEIEFMRQQGREAAVPDEQE
jgi:hypothetical protein